MADDSIVKQDITKKFEPLQDLIRRKEGSNRSPLWQAWHFLHVYAEWGIRLPTTDSDFAAVIDKAAMQFDFFEPMQQGNQKISDACEHFLKNVYNEVLQVGMDLKRYASDSSGSPDGLLPLILDLVEKDNEPDTALALLGSLVDDANSASERAGNVKKSLDSFRTDLGSALGKLDIARTSLDSDSRTNEDTLSLLAGDENTEGSIAYKHKMLEEARRLHTEATVAAATSPAYFWVAPPIGLIATGVVMGIYTDKAIQRMKDIQELEDAIKKDGADKDKAMAARSVFSQGSNGLTNVITYTETASINCGIVQDAWKGISANIDDMVKWLDMTMRENDGQVDVAHKRVLGAALRNVEKAWQGMLPDLTDLMTDNYVTIKPGTATISEAAQGIGG